MLQGNTSHHGSSQDQPEERLPRGWSGEEALSSVWPKAKESGAQGTPWGIQRSVSS